METHYTENSFVTRLMCKPRCHTEVTRSLKDDHLCLLKDFDLFKMLGELVLLLCLLSCSASLDTVPCYFNSMCSCRYSNNNKSSLHIRDVSCVSVPFSKFPELPHNHILHLDIVGAGLETIDGEALGADVEALRLSTNSIMSLGERTFMSTINTLRSLDLSHNRLDSVPVGALCPLKALNWLDLHSNYIAELEDNTLSDWCHLKDTLYSIFLGENDLKELPSTPGKSLAELNHLSWISLDHNKISTINTGSFPESLETLSIQDNYIKEFPFNSFEELSNVKRFFVRGNLIRELPSHGFAKLRTLETFDLGDNNIEYLTENLFNKTLAVRDLNLDYNVIKKISDETFHGMNVVRMFLSMNRIEEISDLAFSGLEKTLEYLDLENNNLYTVPKALYILSTLKYLYISSNKIQAIDNDSFNGFSSSLKFLSLSSNQLTEIPTEALRSCRRLNHLNIGYNLISEVSADNFSGWGEHLDTLLLRNNRIMHLQSNLFKNTPRLRELTLSFNKISEVDPDAFVDVAKSLESLEISFGLYREEFPDDFLKVLKGLLWLALDNNNLRTISNTALSNFINLQYLNLESNRFTYLPSDLFNSSVHFNLRDIRLSYNHINKLETGTFSSLQELQTIVLTGNNIRSIDHRVFYFLPNLVSIVLSENRINTILPEAFSNVANLMRIDLQNNELKGFDFNIFENTMTSFPVSLNISRNQIKVIVFSKSTPLNIKCFDVSHNRLQSVPVRILSLMSKTLKRLHLSYNAITEINPTAFGNLTSLEILTLEHNSIVYLKRRAFSGLASLQILHLSHNHMEQLQIDQFLNLQNLRVLDLSFNHVKSLPRDVFKNTKIERLDLSNNEFVSMPSMSLGDIGFTLRHLDISYNNIDHLDSTMFQETQFITDLDLCHNKLTILPDNVFSALGNLHQLGICKNPIRANLKELFHYIPKVRRLNLAAIGLKVAPVFPLPKLVELNLSSNHLHNLSLNSFESLSSLRTLFLSANKLSSVPTHLWPRLPLLKYLDISMNPVRALTKESFSGLNRLESLILTGLMFLDRFDPGSLNGMKLLTTLKVQS